jgi:hypothetical protein
MKKLYLTIGWFALVAGALHAQNVGIGTASPAIRLDVAGGFATSVTNATSANTLVIPANTSVYRILPGGGATANMSLTASGPIEGQRLLIINDHATYSAMFAGATIAAGGGSGSFAYIGSAWRYFGGSPSSTAWNLTGNAGTNPTTHFVGTTDAQDLSIRAGSFGRIRVYDDGRVLVGSSTSTSQRLTVGGHNSTVRLTGTGANESGATMFFGDGNNVSLQEDVDNALRIDATQRTAIMGGSVGIKTTAPIQDLDVNGRVHVNNGVIQRGGAAITTTSDLGLYSRVAGNWMRFVTNNAPIRFFTDGNVDPIGLTVRVTIEPNGNVGIGDATPLALLTVGNGDLFRVESTGHARTINGTAALPAWSFTAETNSGLYRNGLNDIRLVTGGVDRMRIGQSGTTAEVWVNMPSLYTGDVFTSRSTVNGDFAVNGYNNNTTLMSGGGIYGEVYTGSAGGGAVSSVWGQTFVSQGNGVVGGSNTAGAAIFPNAGSGGAFSTYSAAAQASGCYGTYMGPTALCFGVQGYNGRATGNQNIGVGGHYNGAGYGVGVHGVGFGGGWIPGNFDIAVVGWRANNQSFSGYFNGNHVVASGAKSASVPTTRGNQLLYCMESPEVWFEDFGTANLVNGQVYVELDDLFRQTTVIDDAHPMHVFVQAQGECNDLYVIPGTSGFTVKEKNGGQSNVRFSYRVVAKRLHFQDHRFGNDPVWGPGDTRIYSQYAEPPAVDYHERVAQMEREKREWKPTPMPEGFVYATPPQVTEHRREPRKQ